MLRENAEKAIKARFDYFTILKTILRTNPFTEQTWLLLMTSKTLIATLLSHPEPRTAITITTRKQVYSPGKQWL